MNTDVDYNIFTDTVLKYEQDMNGFSYVCQLSEYSADMHIVKGIRNNRLVIITSHKFLATYIEQQKENILKAFNTTERISDTIDVFSTNDVAPSSQIKISEIGQKLQIAFNIFDNQRLQNIDHFHTLFVDNPEDDADSEVSRALYEYLSMGADSAFIKNSINYTLILFTVYKHPNITVNHLTDILRQKSGYGSNTKSDIIYLRSKGKLKPARMMENSDMLDLTDVERKKISNSITESNETESSFIAEFNKIMLKYKLDDYSELLDDLKKLFVNYYKWNLDDKTALHYDTSNRAAMALNDFKQNISNIIPDNVNLEDLICELKNLCANNAYLSRMALSGSFISLYRSNKYEEFVNDRDNCIIFDTPVFIYFVLCKSDLNEKYNIEFPDSRFYIVKELDDYKNNQRNVNFYIPFDYIGETIGEYQKALRLSIFDKLDAFPIKVHSANTFFNYYIAVKEAKKVYDEDVSHYWFEDFAKEFGFSTTDYTNSNFQHEMSVYFRNYGHYLGCEYIPYITTRYENFEDIKKEYEIELNSKSDFAVKSDVRQAFYISTESQKPENIEKDYFLASWDTSLCKLRDRVKFIIGAQRTYSVKKPNHLLNTLGIKNFNINPENVTNDIFTYADTSFSLTDKIRSLFDNVLAPYFSGCIKQNSSLVNALAEMQKHLIDAEADMGRDIENERRLPLEDIFLDIERALVKNSCSHQDLKKFLCDTSNNDLIVSLFKRAFDSYKTGKPLDISNDICNEIKNMLAKVDSENLENIE